MTDDSSPRPGRRPRYRGKNPRNFAEKYKERAPERYPEEVAKILASGKTPAGSHRPILVQEILQGLKPRPGETAVDCTLGFGGHARELLAAVQPLGRLIALDADPVELPRTEARLRELEFPAESLIVVRSNFAGLSKVLGQHAPAGADVLLADLGVSSMQLDDPARGFSFKVDGPLDMRMNPLRGLSAGDLLSRTREEELAVWLRDYADERWAEELAGVICRAHRQSPITGTRQLAGLVRDFVSRQHGQNSESAELSVRRVFQALRIAVNDELQVLDALLRQLPGCLRAGGRAAILTFHSGEDRRVKQHFRDGARAGIYSHVSEMIQAGPEERRDNPRSSSAKLRVATRTSLGLG